MLEECRSVDRYEKLNRISEGTYGVVYRWVVAGQRVQTSSWWSTWSVCRRVPVYYSA